MRHLILTLALGSSFAFAGKIAVIDQEKVVNETEEGKAGKKKLQDEFQKKQKVLDDKQAELKKLQETLQSQSALMKEDIRQAKGAEFQQKVMEAQQMYGNMQQDMVKRQQDVMGDILKKETPIVKDIAEKGDYDLVLNKSDAVVVYAKPDLDITDMLIKRYNSAYPAGTSKAKKK